MSTYSPLNDYLRFGDLLEIDISSTATNTVLSRAELDSVKVIKLTGTLGSAKSLQIVPIGGHDFLVWNATSGGYSVTISATTGGGSQVLTNGSAYQIFFDNSNLKSISVPVGSVDFSTLTLKTPTIAANDRFLIGDSAASYANKYVTFSLVKSNISLGASDLVGNVGLDNMVLGRIQTVPLTITGLSAGQTLQYNGSAWVNTAGSLNITGLTAASVTGADEIPFFETGVAGNRKITFNNFVTAFAAGATSDIHWNSGSTRTELWSIRGNSGVVNLIGSVNFKQEDNTDIVWDHVNASVTGTTTSWTWYGQHTSAALHKGSGLDLVAGNNTNTSGTRFGATMNIDGGSATVGGSFTISGGSAVTAGSGGDVQINGGAATLTAGSIRLAPGASSGNTHGEVVVTDELYNTVLSTRPYGAGGTRRGLLYLFRSSGSVASEFTSGVTNAVNQGVVGTRPTNAAPANSTLHYKVVETATVGTGLAGQVELDQYNRRTGQLTWNCIGLTGGTVTMNVCDWAGVSEEFVQVEITSTTWRSGLPWAVSKYLVGYLQGTGSNIKQVSFDTGGLVVASASPGGGKMQLVCTGNATDRIISDIRFTYYRS